MWSLISKNNSESVFINLVIIGFAFSILNSNLAYSEEIKLPKSYYCETNSTGGLIKNDNGKWSVGSTTDKYSFTLDILKFNSGNQSDKDLCDTAILVSGKKNDEYSKWQREDGRNICVIQTYRDLKVLPVVRYCYYLNDRIDCEEFSFNTKYLEYFELPPPGMGFDVKSMMIFQGACKLQ